MWLESRQLLLRRRLLFLLLLLLASFLGWGQRRSRRRPLGRLDFRLWCRLRSGRAVGPLLSRRLLGSVLLCRRRLWRRLFAGPIDRLCRLMRASFFRRLLLGRLLLCGLLFASLLCLLLLLLLLLCCLLTASFFRRLLLGGLLLRRLLLTGLVGLLLLRGRGPVGTSWWSLSRRHIRYRRVGRLVHWGIGHWCTAGSVRGSGWRLRVRWRPGVAHGRLADRTVGIHRRRFTRRRLFDHGLCCCNVCWTQDLYFVRSQRLARLLSQLLLLLGKWHRRRRRRCLCHHGTIDYCLRRAGHTIGCLH